MPGVAKSQSPGSSSAPATRASPSARSQDPRLALGRRIKELRAHQELTQEELAERSGLFRTYMSRIESGRANPTLTMLHQIAQAFGLDVRELLAPTEGPVQVRVRGEGGPSRGRVARP